jgi:hypothetical protein
MDIKTKIRHMAETRLGYWWLSKPDYDLESDAPGIYEIIDDCIDGIMTGGDTFEINMVADANDVTLTTAKKLFRQYVISTGRVVVVTQKDLDDFWARGNTYHVWSSRGEKAITTIRQVLKQESGFTFKGVHYLLKSRSDFLVDINN